MTRARKKPLYTTERVSTGIYVNIKTAANTTEGLKALIDEFMKAQNATFDLPARLAKIEEDAARVLDLPKNERPDSVADDARRARSEAKCVRMAMEAGDVARAVCHAITLGRIVEQWSVRPFEPLVRDAKKAHEGRAKGAIATREKATARRKAWQSDVERHMDDPHVSYTLACKRVASTAGVSESTVRIGTTNPRPKRKG
ncbi:MAG: hypothetical protein K1X71_02300 [Pirellulales bacterium]|nr:hypothetical protein [Pirellulales bacterium]